MPLTLHLNGQSRTFETLETPSTLDRIVQALGLQADRVAAELNGEVVPRAPWPTCPVATSDKLEIVHFVGGG